MADVTQSALLHHIQGIQYIRDAFVVLIKTEWNAAIVDELERGCMGVLKTYSIHAKTITVPGAVEIPFAINQCWKCNNTVTAFIALGCVIRGDTPHFDYVCQSVTSGITHLNTSLPVPVVFGVLTVENAHQANERIGGQHGHKGEEAAVTAIKMILLNQQFIKGKM